MAIENPPAFPPSITTNASGAAPERTIAQFFFEVGYAACYADAYIRNDGKPPFELSDALIERAWEIAAEAHDDPAEWDAYKAKADAAPDLVGALQDMLAMRDAHLAGNVHPKGELNIVANARTALRKALGEGEA